MSIIIYTLPNCPRCLVLKRYLDSLNIPYEERNAKKHVTYLIENDCFFVPVLELDGSLYNFETLEQVTLLLRNTGYLT